MKLALMVKNCVWCGAEFTTHLKVKVFCKQNHAICYRKRAWRHRKYATQSWSHPWDEPPPPAKTQQDRIKSKPVYYKKAPRETAEGYEPDAHVPIGFEKEFGQNKSAWI